MSLSWSSVTGCCGLKNASAQKSKSVEAATGSKDASKAGAPVAQAAPIDQTGGTPAVDTQQGATTNPTTPAPSPPTPITVPVTPQNTLPPAAPSAAAAEGPGIVVSNVTTTNESTFGTSASGAPVVTPTDRVTTPPAAY